MEAFLRILPGIDLLLRLFLAASFIFWLPSGSVFALERIDVSKSNGWSQLASVDKRLLLTSCQLQEIVANSELAALKSSKFRKWLDLAGQEVSGAGLLAATAVGVDELEGKLRRPLKIRTNRIKRGLNAGIVTSIIAASASASQLGFDVFDLVKNTKKGYGPRATLTRFEGKLSEFDELLTKREKLISSNQELKDSKVVKAATRLLEVRRSLIAKELLGVYSYVYAYKASQALFYGFDVSRNVSAAIGLNLLKKGLKEPHLNEPGNIWIIVTAGLTMGGPWVSSGCGKALAKYKKWRIKKRVKFNHDLTLSDLHAARKDLRAAIANSGAEESEFYRFSKLSELLDETHGMFDDRLKNELNQRAKLKRGAFQQKLVSGALGGQFLAFGVIGLNAWQRYGSKGRILKFNRDLYAANIVGLVASSMAVGATGVAGVAGEVHDWHLRKNKSGSDYILKEHIERIERVKAEVAKIAE